MGASSVASILSVVFALVVYAFLVRSTTDLGVLHSGAINSTQVNTIIAQKLQPTINYTIGNFTSSMSTNNTYISTNIGTINTRINTQELLHDVSIINMYDAQCADGDTGSRGTTISFASNVERYIASGYFEMLSVTNVYDNAIPSHTGHGPGVILRTTNLVGPSDTFTIDFFSFCRGPNGTSPSGAGLYRLKLLYGTVTSGSAYGDIGLGTLLSAKWVKDGNYTYAASVHGKVAVGFFVGNTIAMVHSQVGGPSATGLSCAATIDIRKIAE